MQQQNKQDLVVEAYVNCGKNKTSAANSLNMPRTTFRRLLKKAQKNKKYKKIFSDDFHVGNEELFLKSRVQDLRKELLKAQKKNAAIEEIKKYIYEIKDLEPEVPEWVSDKKKSAGDVIGVPSLALSDWHWGEVIDSEQVMGVNSYDLGIAHNRASKVIDGAIECAFEHIANPKYPGIVVHILGDMLAGVIHDELIITSEKEVLQVHLDLLGVMIGSLKKLADAFGRVFVPCVPGNHGRLTKKPRAKNYAYDSLDWHLYQLLAKYFEDDDRIRFLIADGEDAQFKIYDWTYRISHGAQFRGGDGIIGPLGPIVRGDTRKRAQARDMNNEYDILVMGHFHQHIALQRIICNGCLSGFSEYAFKGVFPYEKPTQSFWITHPEYGKTFDLPIFAERKMNFQERKDWVSWKE